MKLAIVPVSQMSVQLRIWKYERELAEAARLLDVRSHAVHEQRGRLRAAQQRLWDEEAKKWSR